MKRGYLQLHNTHGTLVTASSSHRPARPSAWKCRHPEGVRMACYLLYRRRPYHRHPCPCRPYPCRPYLCRPCPYHCRPCPFRRRPLAPAAVAPALFAAAALPLAAVCVCLSVPSQAFRLISPVSPALLHKMLCTLLVAVVARQSAGRGAVLAEAASDLGTGQTIDRSIVVGHCGPTSPGECGEGSESGSWNTRRQRIRSLAQCAERCRACPSCSFVSYSKVQLGHNSNRITNALTVT